MCEKNSFATPALYGVYRLVTLYCLKDSSGVISDGQNPLCVIPSHCYRIGL